MADETVEHLRDPVLRHARKDFAALGCDLTVGEALERVRRQGLQDRIVYFYVVDAEQRLRGVLPVRRLLTAGLEERVCDLMIGRVIAIPATATLLDACEFFVLHRLLAFPVVDAERRLVGIVDVDLFTQEVLDFAERERTDDVFESLGFRLTQLRGAGPWRAFRFRFPWLTATIASGLICAVLTGFFEVTLASSLVLAFFLTLMLGLGESVSMQSMTLTVQNLRSGMPTGAWFRRELLREIGTAVLLGGSCGALVGTVVWLWWGQGMTALVLGASILLAISATCVIGLTVPTVLHASKLDPKVAAGPVTLALADICTLSIYFSLAAMML